VDDGVTTLVDTTDVSGYYSFAGLYDNDYDISYTVEDYDDIDVTAYHINDGQDAVLDQTMILSGYAYMPGDANMGSGGWKPAILGADGTILLQYLRSYEVVTCPLGGTGFWMSADANGSCDIAGADATRIIQYLRGQAAAPTYCPDYMPLWLTPDDAPETAPDGWPNCDTPVLGAKVIPTKATNK
jgi:hypothetical protein